MAVFSAQTEEKMKKTWKGVIENLNNAKTGIKSHLNEVKDKLKGKVTSKRLFGRKGFGTCPFERFYCPRKIVSKLAQYFLVFFQA